MWGLSQSRVTYPHNLALDERNRTTPMNDVIENKTFDEIQLGDRASLTGNFNLVDLNSGPKDSSMFGQSGGQAGWSATLFVTLAGTQLPGLGSVAKQIEVRLHLPVAIDMPVTVTGVVTEKQLKTGIVVLECEAVDQEGNVIASGEVYVLAPKEKMRFKAKHLLKLQVQREDQLEKLSDACKGLPVFGCAVAHRCSPDSCDAIHHHCEPH